MRGLGIDVAPASRLADLVARHGDRFVERCFRPGERDRWRRDDDPAVLAECWAAKEAFVKAVGPDGASVPYRDVEVVYVADVLPRLVLHGRAAALVAACGEPACRLSLARRGDAALAVVLLV